MSDFSQSNTVINKPPKTKAEYSRNIKKLKLKLSNIEQQIAQIQKKLKIFSSTSNDKMIAMKISKFCKQRSVGMTPQMIFRCADRYRKKNVSKNVFKETLVSLGIKLSQNQITRLEYLLDEDISGEISQAEYYAFLAAFRIKGEYSNQDKLIKGILDKIDLIKLTDDSQKQDKNKPKQLLNYEDFVKFCHRNMPSLKDKQIAAIFNLLQKNNLIDLDQFLQYIRKKEEQRRKLQQKNKKKKIIHKDSIPDESTLKGLIKTILKYRPKDSKPTFHILQFSKIQKLLQKPKGQLLELFKQIDKNKRGSFGFNELIQFYIDKQRDTQHLLYVYEIMGRKMYVTKQIPQDAICRYNGGPAYKKISLAQFKKFMKDQFNIIQSDAEKVFRLLESKQQVPVRKILDAMKLDQGQKKMMYIKPSLWKTEAKDFWRKRNNTILFNPFVALRFCLLITDQMKKIDQTYWDDYEFGPTFQDPYGQDCIGFETTAPESTKWLTAQSLLLKQFYSQAGDQFNYQASIACPHDIFPKTVCQLLANGEIQMGSKQKGEYHVKKVQEKQLMHLFQGLYPIIFRSFAANGIYVFRFYAHQKWVYVMVDNKIPCNSDGEPMFSSLKDKKYSWLPLVQKAYAKLKGSYAKLFNTNSVSQFVHELSRKLPLKLQISDSVSSQDQKDKLWQKMQQLDQQKQQDKLYAVCSDPTKLIQNKNQTGLKTNQLNQILSLIQLKDQQANNTHKSHRLMLMRSILKNQPNWNISWNNIQQLTNKYDKFYSKLQDQTANKKMAGILKTKYVSVINYRLFRSIFDQFIALRKHSFQGMNVMRKVVQFQQKFTCKYQLNSKSQTKKPLTMMLTLNKLKAPSDTTIQLTQSKKHVNPKQPPVILQKQSLTQNFGAFIFTIDTQLQQLQIKVTNWKQKQDHIYVLTLYMSDPKYHLKQLDRQELFKFVSPHSQMFYLDVAHADQKERLYIYTNYFKNAERSAGCCG